MEKLTKKEKMTINGGSVDAVTGAAPKVEEPEVEEVEQEVCGVRFAAGVACGIAGAISPDPITTAAGVWGGAALIGDATGKW